MGARWTHNQFGAQRVRKSRQTRLVPTIGPTLETTLGVQQLDPTLHDELTRLSKQLKNLQARSPVLPPTDNEIDQAAQGSEGECTMRGSKAPSKTGTISGLDMQEIGDGEEEEGEEMDEGEVDAMPSVLLLVGPKEVTPKKDDTQR